MSYDTELHTSGMTEKNWLLSFLVKIVKMELKPDLPLHDADNNRFFMRSFLVTFR